MKKKLILAFTALLIAASAAVAQESVQPKPGGKRPDKQEMVKKHTERMVTRYGLNDKQAKKLLALNTKYADTALPRFGGPHHGKGPKGEGRGPQGAQRDSVKRQPPVDGQTGATHQQRPPRPEKPQGAAPSKADREAYNKALKKLMTAQQYAKYEADAKKMRQGHGHKGQRPAGQH